MKSFKRVATLASLLFLGAMFYGATPAVAGTWLTWLSDTWNDTLSLGEFLAQVMQTAKIIDTLPVLLQVSAIITLAVSSLKVTVLRRLVWERLGAGQVLVAPALGLVAGLLGLGAAGAPVTIPLVLTYVMAGGGAVFLHELLDAIKSLPGLGLAYIKAIDAIERALGGSDGAKRPAAAAARAHD